VDLRGSRQKAEVDVNDMGEHNGPIAVQTMTNRDVPEGMTRELAPFGITVEQFVETELDDHEDWRLRELWMFYRDALAMVLDK
jgi:hypothetical protein